MRITFISILFFILTGSFAAVEFSPIGDDSTTPPQQQLADLEKAVSHTLSMMKGTSVKASDLDALDGFYGQMLGVYLNQGKQAKADEMMEKCNEIRLPLAAAKLREWEPANASSRSALQQNQAQVQEKMLKDLEPGLNRKGAKGAAEYVDRTWRFVVELDMSTADNTAKAKAALTLALQSFRTLEKKQALTSKEKEVVTAVVSALEKLPKQGAAAKGKSSTINVNMKPTGRAIAGISERDAKAHGLKRYQDSDRLFSICIPEGWKSSRNASEGAIFTSFRSQDETVGVDVLSFRFRQGVPEMSDEEIPLVADSSFEGCMEIIAPTVKDLQRTSTYVDKIGKVKIARADVTYSKASTGQHRTGWLLKFTSKRNDAMIWAYTPSEDGKSAELVEQVMGTIAVE